MNTAELTLAAAKARRLVLRMFEATSQGHLGGAFSIIEILTVLYFKEMKIDSSDPKMEDRDRFLLSAGHKAMAQYAILALAGYFPYDVLDSYGQFNSRVPGHPDMTKLAGIEANTGALGHGLPIAAGMAFGLRMRNLPSRVFVLMGDGELPEGSNWEAASISAHHRLDNLVAIVDANGMQIGGRTCDVLNMEPIAHKFASFGWNVMEMDGHDLDDVSRKLRSTSASRGRPTAIVARTIKGRGITAIEGTVQSHYWKPNSEALLAAINEVESVILKHQELQR